MNEKKSNGRPQFGIARLLYFVTCLAIIFAARAWIVQSDSFGSTSDIPILFMPSIQTTGFGIVAVPFISLGTLWIMVFVILRNRPRPLSALIFFGFVAMVFTLSHEHTLRHLIGITVCSFVFLIESLVRKLPTAQIVAAFMSVFICMCYYLFILSVIMSP